MPDPDRSVFHERISKRQVLLGSRGRGHRSDRLVSQLSQQQRLDDRDEGHRLRDGVLQVEEAETDEGLLVRVNSTSDAHLVEERVEHSGVTEEDGVLVDDALLGDAAHERVLTVLHVHAELDRSTVVGGCPSPAAEQDLAARRVHVLHEDVVEGVTLLVRVQRTVSRVDHDLLTARAERALRKHVDGDRQVGVGLQLREQIRQLLGSGPLRRLEHVEDRTSGERVLRRVRLGSGQLVRELLRRLRTELNEGGTTEQRHLRKVEQKLGLCRFDADRELHCSVDQGLSLSLRDDARDGLDEVRHKR